jgi:cytoskeleton protein RodZ
MKSENSAETQQFDAAELGAMMREMRENLGHDLASVASDLRIRLVYLEAIESGRLADLPGSAYVSGFLRAYSDFLGLDGEEIVRRFRMAGVDIRNQTQLHLPSPVEEGRLPTGPILLLAAIVAAVAYGGWYYFSTPDSNPVDRIASLPAELSRMVGADSDSSPSAAPASPAAASPRETADATARAAEPAATAPQAAPESTSPAPMASETGSADGAATDASPAAPATSAPSADSAPAPSAEMQPGALSSETAPPAEASAGMTREPSADTSAAVAPPETPSAPAEMPAAPAAAVSEPPAALPETGSTAAAAPETPPPAPEPAAETPDQTPPPSPAPAAESASVTPAPTGASASPGAKRIVVRATADSFVAVLTSDNQPLFSQLMRAGDSYEVPSGAGLILETGNAGALEIRVDGRQIPSLGPVGEIRRNIPLDAEKLLAGIN